MTNNIERDIKQQIKKIKIQTSYSLIRIFNNNHTTLQKIFRGKDRLIREAKNVSSLKKFLMETNCTLRGVKYQIIIIVHFIA